MQEWSARVNVLDTIDTTVTFEWGDTRTIGTLVQLGGRLATVTSLRAPDVGAAVFLRVEGDSPQDGLALDGVCTAISDSEWGEQQVEVTIQRVGTTVSAVVLRAFIEKHGIDRGGTVSIGRNRDNPDLKRYVYALPEPGAVVQESRDPDATRMLQAVVAPEEKLASDARPFPLEAPVPIAEPVLEIDADEVILVNTVEAGVAFADPVMVASAATGERPAEAGGSLVQRLFGKKVTMPDRPVEAPPPEPEAHPERPAVTPARVGSPLSRVPDKPITGSMQAVQQLFAVDLAVRADRPIQFEATKKKRAGVLLRLAESKLRIRSGYQPQLYERIVVALPPAEGRKDSAMVQCEVVRVRAPDSEGGESAFDARVTGGNSAQIMTRLRAFIAELEPPQGRAAG
jgi:hypothetical protein